MPNARRVPRLVYDTVLRRVYTLERVEWVGPESAASFVSNIRVKSKTARPVEIVFLNCKYLTLKIAPILLSFWVILVLQAIVTTKTLGEPWWLWSETLIVEVEKHRRCSHLCLVDVLEDNLFLNWNVSLIAPDCVIKFGDLIHQVLVKITVLVILSNIIPVCLLAAFTLTFPWRRLFWIYI